MQQLIFFISFLFLPFASFGQKQDSCKAVRFDPLTLEKEASNNRLVIDNEGSINREIEKMIQDFKNPNNQYNLCRIVPRNTLGTDKGTGEQEEIIGGQNDTTKPERAHYKITGIIDYNIYDENPYIIYLRLFHIGRNVDDNNVSIRLTMNQFKSYIERNDSLKVLVQRLLNPKKLPPPTKPVDTDNTEEGGDPLPPTDPSTFQSRKCRLHFMNTKTCWITETALLLVGGGLTAGLHSQWEGYYEDNKGLDIENKYDSKNRNYKFSQGMMYAGIGGLVVSGVVYLCNKKKKPSQSSKISVKPNDGIGVILTF
jgi:hypothetical protein